MTWVENSRAEYAETVRYALAPLDIYTLIDTLEYFHLSNTIVYIKRQFACERKCTDHKRVDILGYLETIRFMSCNKREM